MQSPKQVSAVVPLEPNQASFTVPQCARYFGVSAWQIRMLIWEGRLPARRIGKPLVIRRVDADKFLEGTPEVGPSDAPWLAKRKPRTNGGAA